MTKAALYNYHEPVVSLFRDKLRKARAAFRLSTVSSLHIDWAPTKFKWNRGEYR